MHLEKSERKVLIFWFILMGLATVVLSIFITQKVEISNNEKEIKKLKNNSVYSNSNYISDINLYYTVKSSIIKMYSRINSNDEDGLSKIISEDYLTNNNININDYINSFNKDVGYNSTDKMCLKNINISYYDIVTKGYEVNNTDGSVVRNVYYEVILDYSNMIFSIIPISEIDYGGICNNE